MMKIGIMIISVFAMPEKHGISVTGNNKNNLNSDLGFCTLFYTERKYGDRLDNYSWSEKLSIKN